jgi:hypothetical protein
MKFDINDFSTWGPLLGAGAGALAGSYNGSKQAGTSTSTTAPWAVQQPYLQDIFQRAQNQSQQPGVSSGMQSALSGMQGAINPALTNQAQGVISNTLGADPSQYFGIGRQNQYQGQTTAPVANPYLGMDNPYLNHSIDSASQDAMRNLMPAFNQAQAASGSFGNSGVADTFGRAAGNAVGNISNNARMNQFNQNSQMTQSLGFGNAQLSQGDLARNSNLAQTGINNDIGQYNQGAGVINNAAFNTPQFQGAGASNQGTLFNASSLANNAQWSPLQNYSNLVNGSYGGSSSQPYYSNPVNGGMGGAVIGTAIGGALAGNNSLYSSLFGKAG